MYTQLKTVSATRALVSAVGDSGSSLHECLRDDDTAAAAAASEDIACCCCRGLRFMPRVRDPLKRRSNAA